MQILALLTMERPRAYTGKDLCDEKTRLLSWMTPIDHQETIIGQYVKSADGKKPAFQDEEDVPDGSKCATFCAAVAHINNERWSGVPILLKAGKGRLLVFQHQCRTFTGSALEKTGALVTVNFHSTPNALIFDEMTPNRMIIRVQPDEGIFLRVNTLVPDLEVKTEAVDLDMSYRGTQVPEAYEALLFDAMKGVCSRRVRADEIDASWTLWAPMLKYLEEEDITPREYSYGESYTQVPGAKLSLTLIGSTGPQGLEEFVASCQSKVPR